MKVMYYKSNPFGYLAEVETSFRPMIGDRVEGYLWQGTVEEVIHNIVISKEVIEAMVKVD